LYLFQCCNRESLCPFWVDGAHTCIVVEPEALLTRPTPYPGNNAHNATPPEVFVHGWLEREDLVRPADYPRYFSEPESHYRLPRSVQESVTHVTRLGSVPDWLDSSADSMKGYRFLGQLDTDLSFYRQKPTDVELSVWDEFGAPAHAGRTYSVPSGYLFNREGMAYLFCKDGENGQLPDVRFFWHCG
jgi:hypothetical protein